MRDSDDCCDEITEKALPIYTCSARCERGRKTTRIMVNCQAFTDVGAEITEISDIETSIIRIGQLALTFQYR